MEPTTQRMTADTLLIFDENRREWVFIKDNETQSRHGYDTKADALRAWNDRDMEWEPASGS